jgi:hypothetical protein
MKCLQEYLTAEIAYTINTEAGFLIGRKGVVSLTSVGPFIQGQRAFDPCQHDVYTSQHDVYTCQHDVYTCQYGVYTGASV